ncbi:MAG: hypothetical protein PHE68_05835 [Candidatus Peribacteraceae bacterium]|nr:hypothetical protein [Candidatus Peribacteraceae bacterium]MDD5075406.1 hypothetical protein [Candidatus Peribacteraceae bacterium]
MPFDIGSLLIFAVVIASGFVAMKNQKSWQRLSLKQKVLRASLSAIIAFLVAVGIVAIVTSIKT